MIFERVAVGQHPFAVGRVGAMAVTWEDILCDEFGLMRLIGVMVVLLAMRIAV